MYQSFNPPKAGSFEHGVKDVWNSSRRVGKRKFRKTV